MVEWATAAQWEERKALITSLYLEQRMTLPKLVALMRAKYQFHASPRMFKGKFKQWGLRKNRSSRPNDRRGSSIAAAPKPVAEKRMLDAASPQHTQSLPSPSESATVVSASPDTVDHDRGLESLGTKELVDIIVTSVAALLTGLLSTRCPLSPPATPVDRQGNTSAATGGDDHSDMFRELQSKLQHEQKLHGSIRIYQTLLKKQPDESSREDVWAETLSYVTLLVKDFHPEAAIGVVGIFNMLEEVDIAKDLSASLVQNCSSFLPEPHDFRTISHCIRALVEGMSFENFKQAIQELSLRISNDLESIFGSQSLLGIYLKMLLKFRPDGWTKEQRIQERNKLQHSIVNVFKRYGETHDRGIQFSYYILGQLVWTHPQADGLIEMLGTLRDRSSNLLQDAESSQNKSRIRDAAFYLSRAFFLISEVDRSNNRIKEARSNLHKGIEIQRRLANPRDRVLHTKLLELQNLCLESPVDGDLHSSVSKQLNDEFHHHEPEH